MSFIKNKSHDEDGLLSFVLEGVSTSYANALRRVVLSEIEIFAMKDDSEHIKIEVNSSPLNNEILRHRLSCVPVHISDTSIDISTLIIECDVTNETDGIIDVTTEHLKVKDKNSGNYIDMTPFPSDNITKDYIVLTRLRPRLNLSVEHEQLKFEASLSICNPTMSSVYNCVSKCSYGFTVDPAKQKQVWSEKEKQLKENDMDSDSIVFEKKNWYLHDGKRVYKDDSYDFIVQSLGVFQSTDIMKKACYAIMNRMGTFLELIEGKSMEIKKGDTVEPSFDVVIENDNYTYGKLLESTLYQLYYVDQSVISFIGHRKLHPYDSSGIIRIMLNDANHTEDYVYSLFKIATEYIRKVYDRIAKEF